MKAAKRLKKKFKKKKYVTPDLVLMIKTSALRHAAREPRSMTKMSACVDLGTR